MASPCEVQIDGEDLALLDLLGRIAEAEARRIEVKFSRYNDNSIISQINRSNGATVAVDSETMALLRYANSCYELSEGLFDITSGVLRRLWTFDGSDKVPTAAQVNDLLPLVGWPKVTLGENALTLLPGMEIDFGGLGKEYAVDRAMLLISARTDVPILVNFGGDLRVSGLRADGSPWRIAVEAVDTSIDTQTLEVKGGALTTSGDAKRFLLKDGIRYSHILDPRTGWPVVDPPRSVTVAASTCMEAGIFSTLAMAKGAEAERFVTEERCAAWISR
ncbi:MAG: FAD:protein FMN transferase [Chakrabartia sp.]